MAEHEMVLPFSLWVSLRSARTAIDIAAIVGCGLFQNTKDGCLQFGGAETVRHMHPPWLRACLSTLEVVCRWSSSIEAGLTSFSLAQNTRTPTGEGTLTRARLKIVSHKICNDHRGSIFCKPGSYEECWEGESCKACALEMAVGGCFQSGNWAMRDERHHQQ